MNSSANALVEATEESNETRMCIICEEAPREVRFACGHATVCKSYLPDKMKKHRKCPMCNVAFGTQPVAEHGAHVRTAPTFVLPRCSIRVTALREIDTRVGRT